MVSRERTIHFRLKDLERITQSDVIAALDSVCRQEDILAIQLTSGECYVTFKNVAIKRNVQQNGILLKGKDVALFDSDKDITNVTIKDLPYEVSDTFLMSSLGIYGEVVSGSCRRGKIKGTHIDSGTRYVQIQNVKGPIPNDTLIGKYRVRIFCDNGKTLCRYCDSPMHPYYKCTMHNKPRSKRCFRCKSDQHLISHCPEKCDCGKMTCPSCSSPEQPEHNPESISNPKEICDQDKHDHEENFLPKHSTPANAPNRPEDKEGQLKLIIGASNCVGMSRLVDDPSVKVLAESGFGVGNVNQLLDKENNLDNVSIVVMHLGTNDLKRKNSDANSIILNTLSAVTTIRTRVPNIVQIGLCSIPPKRGNSAGCDRFNNAAKTMNRFMQTYCDQYPDVLFIDNTSVLTGQNGKPIKAMYNLDDSSGIHYSREGHAAVVKNIEHALHPPSGFLEILRAGCGKRNLSELSSFETQEAGKRPNCMGAAVSNSFNMLMDEESAQNATAV